MPTPDDWYQNLPWPTQPNKVLVLEDDSMRVTSFRTLLSDNIVHFASDVAEFYRLLEENHYFAIYLDHDLGSEKIEMGGVSIDNDGMYACYCIDALQCSKSTNIIIHSSNVVAAPKMVQRLRDYGYINVYQQSFVQMIKEAQKP